MNGPYPPVLPPKPPNIEVSHTVDVTTTGNLERNRKVPQPRNPPESAKREEVNTSHISSEPTRQRTSTTRTSVFAESLEPAPSRAKLKLEPRTEPPGSAFRKRRPGNIAPEIGIISFLCEYPRVRAQGIEAKRHALHSFLRPSTSERRLLSGSKQKMAAAVAKKRTSDGQGYGQIVIQGLYEGQNKSTYQVNVVEGAGWKSKKDRSKSKLLGQEMVKSAKKREPIESMSGDGESAVVTSDEMADSIHLNLNDGLRKEEVMRQEREKENAKRERSPAPMLPLQKAVESNFGIDFASILKRHEEVAVSPKKVKRGSLNTSLMTRSESRPNVRDFAGEGSSNFIRSAFRRRSKSPIKKIPIKEDSDKQSPLKQSPTKKQDRQKDGKASSPRAPPPIPEVSDLSVYTRRINSIRDSVAQHAGLGALIPLSEPEPTKVSKLSDKQTLPAISQNQRSSGSSSNARNSSTSNGHSKSPSGMSAGSIENDNLSEVSSAIISDAQSISIHKTNGSAEWGPNGSIVRKPMRPGPAPTGPLPSLPEGHDVHLPTTPRHSDSIQRPSPERSPPKSKQKTQPRYRFTPADESSNKIAGSPTRADLVRNPEEPIKKPAALVKIKTANLNDFPAPPLPSLEKSKRQVIASALSSTLSTSTSDSTFSARVERTRKIKAKDLALERVKPPSISDASPPPLPTTRTMPSFTTHRGNDGHKDSIDYLIDSYDTSSHVANGWHGPQQPSLISAFSTASTTQDNRNSAHLSEISPIVVVAEQEPVSILPKPLSVKQPSSEYPESSSKEDSGIDRPFPYKPPSSPTIDPPDSRPTSDCSSQHNMSARIKSPSRSLANPIANRPATPFFPAPDPLQHQRSSQHLQRQNSHHSSHHRSSLLEPDLESRIAAMERKNLLLERAFLAVMDASVSISSGRDSGGSFATGERGPGQSVGMGERGRDSGSAGVGSFEYVAGENGDGGYEELESLLVRRGSGKGKDVGRPFGFGGEGG